jgi:hypothetical protein
MSIKLFRIKLNLLKSKFIYIKLNLLIIKFNSVTVHAKPVS